MLNKGLNYVTLSSLDSCPYLSFPHGPDLGCYLTVGKLAFGKLAPKFSCTPNLVLVYPFLHHMSATPAVLMLLRLRQEGQLFEASLGYIASC